MSRRREVEQPEPSYTIGCWNGLDNYQCRHCPYSTLDLEEIERHQQQRHGPPPPPPVVAHPTLVDRFGNPLPVQQEGGE